MTERQLPTGYESLTRVGPSTFDGDHHNWPRFKKRFCIFIKEIGLDAHLKGTDKNHKPNSSVYCLWLAKDKQKTFSAPSTRTSKDTTLG
jgi:hypothetical protein